MIVWSLPTGPHGLFGASLVAVSWDTGYRKQAEVRRFGFTQRSFYGSLLSFSCMQFALITLHKSRAAFCSISWLNHSELNYTFDGSLLLLRPNDTGSRPKRCLASFSLITFATTTSIGSHFKLTARQASVSSGLLAASALEAEAPEHDSKGTSKRQVPRLARAPKP